jgi:hypothetical protein
MALDHSTPPASSGLTSQVATLTGLLGAFVADLDPDTLLGSDAAALYASVAKLERLVVAAKCLLAPRIATSGHWEAAGHRSPAGLLATLEGVSTGQARRTLVTGQHLVGLPATEEALRSGVLSGPKAALVTDAAALDPTTESGLLAGAADEGLSATKERCARARATSARHDPLATARRIHAERHFSHWTDAEGAFCFSGRDSAERGAALLVRLVPAANRLRDARRAAVTDATHSTTHSTTGSPATATPPEPEAALRADALFALLTGGSGPSSTGQPGTGPSGTGPPGTRQPSTGQPSTGPPDPDGSPPGLQSADDLAQRPPPATVIVRVDRDALLRGHTIPGELCELDGQGPVPVPLARALAVDSFLSIVFTEAGDIRAVAHLGRTINATLRTALTYRDRNCVVPGCAMPYGLEIDHVRPMELGGVTTLDNLALLCRHHHRLKTYDGWVLERHGPSDEDPQWSFTPQPPFGQEPDLGLDRPPDGPSPDNAPPDDPPPVDPPPVHPPPDDERSLFDRPPEVVPRR